MNLLYLDRSFIKFNSNNLSNKFKRCQSKNEWKIDDFIFMKHFKSFKFNYVTCTHKFHSGVSTYVNVCTYLVRGKLNLIKETLFTSYPIYLT
jgi:hypothetical protein